MPWPPKQDPSTNYTEEDVVVVSKGDLSMVWAGAKVLYSGTCSGVQASGYFYDSGESDVQPINASGWGEIRIPEFQEVHKMFVTPKSPCIQAAVDWVGGNCSGDPASGIGGVSGNVALVHYCDTEVYNSPDTSGEHWASGTSFVSGVVDVIAFGSIY